MNQAPKMIFFCFTTSSALNFSEKKDIFCGRDDLFFGLHLDVRGRDDFFFGLHLNLSGKLDIRGHAVLGNQIFIILAVLRRNV